MNEHIGTRALRRMSDAEIMEILRRGYPLDQARGHNVSETNREVRRRAKRSGQTVQEWIGARV